MNRLLKVVLGGFALDAAIGVGSSYGLTLSVTTTNDSGAGSLRDAITQANANPGQDTIIFKIESPGVSRIIPASALPEIAEALVLDGYSQTGSSANTESYRDGAVILIEIDGSQVGTNADGLVVSSGNTTIRGVAINGFDDEISLYGGGSNVVEGCFIGCHASGTGGLGDDGAGVRIDNSAGNLIGGTSPAARNLISGNGGGYYGGFGMVIYGSNATANLVQGNFIGVDFTGTNVLFQGDGIQIINASNNTIGGTNFGAGNIVGGNGRFGILIGVRGGAGTAAAGNVVQGNLIGVSFDQTLGASNGQGVKLGDPFGSIDNAITNNLIGGSDFGAGNYIGDNGYGVSLEGVASSNRVQGNLIVENSFYGVEVGVGAHDNQVGGPSYGEGNVISGNLVGILVWDVGLPVKDNKIQGNLIGTDPSGMYYWGNYEHGILLTASHQIIGGVEPGAGNVVSGNFVGGCIDVFGCAGIEIRGADNVVQGNLIGTDITGTNPLGNVGDGILVYYGSFSNVIGGTELGAGNIISGNFRYGVALQACVENTVQGNFIGTDVTGTLDLGNFGAGVNVNGYNHLIGGIEVSAGNIVAFNRGEGVRLGNAEGTRVQRNSIYGNGGVGISWNYEPTPAPTLTGAVSLGGVTTVRGSVAGSTNAQLRLEFFSNAECDTSGFGEGKTFIGSIEAVSEQSGPTIYQASFPVSVPNSSFITATATDHIEGTSKFSNCLQIPTGLVDTGTVHDLAITQIKAPKRVRLTRRQPVRSVDIQVDVQNRSAHLETISDYEALNNLVKVTITPLGTNCPTPTISLHVGQPQPSLPIALPSKATMSLHYDVSLNCATDLRKMNKHRQRADYSISSRVNHTYIDGYADGHPEDDLCPRSVPLGGVVDPNPDASIVDRGCGYRTADGTFGGDVLIDVIGK